jgi:hypothetical protein
MRSVTFYEQPRQAIGQVILHDSGAIEVTSQTLRTFLSRVKVIDPDTQRPVKREDGERYIAALPHAFAGVYLRAELDRDQGD